MLGWIIGTVINPNFAKVCGTGGKTGQIRWLQWMLWV